MGWTVKHFPTLIFRFSLKSNGPRPYSPSVIQEYPLVQLQGNHRIVLEHYPKKVSNSGRYEVRMHEDDWVRLGNEIISHSLPAYSSLLHRW